MGLNPRARSSEWIRGRSLCSQHPSSVALLWLGVYVTGLADRGVRSERLSALSIGLDWRANKGFRETVWIVWANPSRQANTSKGV